MNKPLTKREIKEIIFAEMIRPVNIDQNGDVLWSIVHIRTMMQLEDQNTDGITPLASLIDGFIKEIAKGVKLETVESWCDAEGLHPISEDGIPDLRKSETVKYSEIEFIEFTEIMSVEDARLYREVLAQFDPTSLFASKKVA